MGYNANGHFTTGKVVFTTSNVTNTSVQLSWTSDGDLLHGLVHMPCNIVHRLDRVIGLEHQHILRTSLIKNLTEATTYECRIHIYQNTYLWGISQIGTFYNGRIKRSRIDQYE